MLDFSGNFCSGVVGGLLKFSLACSDRLTRSSPTRELKDSDIVLTRQIRIKDLPCPNRAGGGRAIYLNCGQELDLGVCTLKQFELSRFAIRLYRVINNNSSLVLIVGFASDDKIKTTIRYCQDNLILHLR